MVLAKTKSSLLIRLYVLIIMTVDCIKRNM